MWTVKKVLGITMLTSIAALFSYDAYKIDTQYKNYQECCSNDKESNNCRWNCHNLEAAPREMCFTDITAPLAFGALTLVGAVWWDGV